MVEKKFEARRAAPDGVLSAGALLVTALSLALMLSACGGKGQDEEAPSDGEEAVAFEYPSALSAESSPSEVAQVLIQALDEDDTETLLGLVATKAGAEAIEAIFSARGRKSNMTPAQVAALPVSGWRATYAFFLTGETEVTREEVHADTALVFANGKKPEGRSQTLKIKLIREDGLWKVRLGLQPQ